MRTLRLSLAVTVILALLGGLGVAVVAQVKEDAGQATAQMLSDMLTEAWNNDDVALLEEVYAPDAAHKAVYFDGTWEAVGRPAIIDTAMGSSTVTPITPLIELDAADGELRWVRVVDVVAPAFPGTGTVCSFWARDGQVVRHDCLLPMNCIPGVCTP
jgi:hypothetical protein